MDDYHYYRLVFLRQFFFYSDSLAFPVVLNQVSQVLGLVRCLFCFLKQYPINIRMCVCRFVFSVFCKNVGVLGDEGEMAADPSMDQHRCAIEAGLGRYRASFFSGAEK